MGEIMKNAAIGIFFAFILLLSSSDAAHSQDTFAPVCEEGTTCAPTPQLPVTGPMETTFALLGVGGLFLLSGISGIVTYALARKSS